MLHQEAPQVLLMRTACKAQPQLTLTLERLVRLYSHAKCKVCKWCQSGDVHHSMAVASWAHVPTVFGGKVVTWSASCTL